MERSAAVDRIERIIDTIESEIMAVPLRELWVYGDVALGLDPIDRLDIYLTKEVLIDGSPAEADTLEAEFGVKGLGTTVQAEWANANPEHIVANTNGYAAPEKCLASHLLPSEAPIHLEVCNAGFESNVIQRYEAAKARSAYEELLDPRAVCVWKGGQRSDDAITKLRDGSYVFPTLEEALQMLGLAQDQASHAAKTVQAWKTDLEGPTVRGDVV